MSKKIISLLNLINSFGFLKSIEIMFKKIFSKKKIVKIRSRKYKHDIYIRQNTSDWAVFFEIFCADGYSKSLNDKVSVIIDAGANVGYAAVYFANKYPEAKIFCLEPEESNFQMILKNTRKYSNIVSINAALWYEDKQLCIEDKTARKYSFRVTEEHNECSVDAISIETLMKKYNINDIDIVKIDIEGSELELFSNNTVWIEKCKQVIIETHDRIKLGTNKMLFRAIDKYDYIQECFGENLFITFIKY